MSAATTAEKARQLEASLRNQGWGNVPNDPIPACPSYIANYNQIYAVLPTLQGTQGGDGGGDGYEGNFAAIALLTAVLERTRMLKDELWRVRIGSHLPIDAPTRIHLGHRVPYGDTLLCDPVHVATQEDLAQAIKEARNNPQGSSAALRQAYDSAYREIRQQRYLIEVAEQEVNADRSEKAIADRLEAFQAQHDNLVQQLQQFHRDCAAALDSKADKTYVESLRAETAEALVYADKAFTHFKNGVESLCQSVLDPVITELRWGVSGLQANASRQWSLWDQAAQYCSSQSAAVGEIVTEVRRLGGIANGSRG